MKYDLAIIGGGLAGLALAIDVKNRGYNVMVIEKGNYPRHKVCGEYISMESHNYLEGICPALARMELPSINEFKLTSTDKKEFTTPLEQGGFGISRYLLEELLFKEAEKQGVKFMLNTKVNEVGDETDTVIKTNGENVSATLVCNSTGRKSNIKVPGSEENSGNANYVGVKYHVRLWRNPQRIEIHNFPGGYCGVSGIEDGKSCLCYIVNSKKLNSAGNSIPTLEKKYLFKNSNLEKIFGKADFIFSEPVTVSGINFTARQPFAHNSFFIGDSAGSIAPITGNGMSMALRSASTFANNADLYFSGKISKEQLVSSYTRSWKKEFSTRIYLGRYWQKLSEYSFLTKRTIELFNIFPPLARSVIRQTHGKPF